MSSMTLVQILSFGGTGLFLLVTRTGFTQAGDRLIFNQKEDYGSTSMLDKYCRIASYTGGPKLLDSRHLSRLSDGLSKLRNWLLL